jgi:hypothetical protein
VTEAQPDETLLVMYRSTVKPVQERLKSYYGKYLPMVQEITPEEFATIEVKPDSPKYAKARAAFVANRLDRRPPKKPPEDELMPAPPPPPPPQAMVGRRGPARA